MIEFIMANIEAIALMLAAIVTLIYAIYTKQWSAVRSAALSFMLSAERLMVTGQGSARMDAVFRATWERVPAWIKTFVTEKTMRDKLQEWYELAKDELGK